MSRSVAERIKEMETKVNPNYIMDCREWFELVDMSQDSFYTSRNGFYFGYLKGFRAAKAEMKKKEKKTA